MIQLKKDNQTINAPIGYSFTTFFFGFFPMLFRGDFAMAGVIFAIGIELKDSYFKQAKINLDLAWQRFGEEATQGSLL